MQQFFAGVTVFREQGNADGGPQPDGLFGQQERGFKVVENALRQLRDLIGLIDIGLYQCKLITPQARKGPQPTAVRAQAVSHGHQQLVAGLITVLFVDAFEIVQPHAQHPHPALQATGIEQDLGELGLQLLAIGQPGQKVVLGHAQQSVFSLMAQVGIALDGGQ